MNENNESIEKTKPHRNWAVQRRDIVGMLLAIVVATVVFNRFSAMRDVARETSCSVNLRQISNGLMQYIREYDEKMPPKRKWVQATIPYVGNRKKPRYVDIYQCPMRRDLFFGYAMHDKTTGLSLATFPRPNNTVWVFDADVSGPNVDGGKELLPTIARHPNGNMAAFMDGHVKVVKNVDFSKGFRSSAENQRWLNTQAVLGKMWEVRNQMQNAADAEFRKNKSLTPEKRRYDKARMLEEHDKRIAEMQRKQ